MTIAEALHGIDIEAVICNFQYIA